MVQAIPLASGVFVDLEDGSLEFVERIVVHDDWDSERDEAIPLIRSVLLDGNPKPGAAASEQVPDREDGAGEVRLFLQLLRCPRCDRERGRFVRHGMMILSMAYRLERGRRRPIAVLSI